MNTPVRSLLSAALLSSSLAAPLAAAAATPEPSAVRGPLLRAALAQTPPAPPSPEDGEEDSAPTDAARPEQARDGAEGTALQPGALPGPGPAPTLAAGGDSAASTVRLRGELVSGAPLSNPDVAVHIVERKTFSDVGRHELTLYPFVPQANGKFTQHFGTAAAYTFHVQENFALQLTPQWNWLSAESAFNQELVNNLKATAQAASSLLLEWGVQGGFEVTPIYGKFAFNEDLLAQFSVILNAGAGVGSTRHQLVPPSVNSEGVATEPTFGSTGMRFMGSVGGGFRVQMGDRFALRLEVRDLVYTARVDRVNGCTLADVNTLLENGAPSAGCNAAAFRNAQGERKSIDLAIARDLIEEPSSDVLNLVNFYTGLSYLF